MTSSDAMLTIRRPAGETVSDAGQSFLPLAFACIHTHNGARVNFRDNDKALLTSHAVHNVHEHAHNSSHSSC